MKDAMLTVRLPRETRGRIEALARREGRSLSQQVERLLEQALATPAVETRQARALSGAFAGGRVPTLADFREVRGLLGSSMKRRLERYDQLDRRHARGRVARDRSTPPG